MTTPDRGTVVRDPRRLAPDNTVQREKVTHTLTRPEVPTRTLSGLTVTVPARRRTIPHTHQDSETITHLIDGDTTLAWPGGSTELSTTDDALVYLPAGTPHTTLSDRGGLLTEVRTDPWGNADVHLRTESAQDDAPFGGEESTELPPANGHRVVPGTPHTTSGGDKQGPAYRALISSKVAPVRGLSVGLLDLPPGGRVDHVWVHRRTERIVYCAAGTLGLFCGDALRPRVLDEGTFFWSSPKVPYLVVNLSTTEPARAFEYRTDPHFDRDLFLAQELVDDDTERRIHRLRDITRAKNAPLFRPRRGRNTAEGS